VRFLYRRELPLHHRPQLGVTDHRQSRAVGRQRIILGALRLHKDGVCFVGKHGALEGDPDASQRACRPQRVRRLKSEVANGLLNLGGEAGALSGKLDKHSL